VSRAVVGLVLALGLFVAVAAGAALWLGIDEALLASSGPRRDFAAEELPSTARGFVAVFGCVRHDLAVGVTARKTVYALGARPPDAEDEDRVFTPLSSRAECDEGTPPKKIYALVEDDDALGNTIGRVYQTRVAPPPVPAFVEGVIGYGAGSGRLARAAAQQLGLDSRVVPLLAKGRHPGVRWVAILTAAAGAHGFLLLAIVALWIRRKQRRATNESHFSDEENSFLNDHE
jgi:hypothetical protein